MNIFRILTIAMRLLITLASTILLLIISTNVQAQGGRSYSGLILDFDSREPLAGASVVVQERGYGTQTDSLGKFDLFLSNEREIIEVSYGGYHKQTFAIFSYTPLNKAFFLKRKPADILDEVIVEAGRNNASVRDIRMSDIHINPALLRKTPLVLGESDILRSLTLQPGIVTPGETVSGYSVRGGNADQNLVLLDGAPLFNVAHLLGIYTGVNADAVQDVTFFKAGIPVQYGSRLSSVMLVNAKEGTRDSTRFQGGIGPMSARAIIRTPLIRNKVSLMAGGRIAYPKLVMNLFPEGDVKNSDAFYHDNIAKLSITPNGVHQISATFYNSFDRYKFAGDTSFDWKNLLGAFNWKINAGKRVGLNLHANFSKYESAIIGEAPFRKFRLQSGVQQAEVKLETSYKVDNKTSIIAGLGAIEYRINPGHQSPSDDRSIIIERSIEQEKGREYSLFAGIESNLTNKLGIQAGLRASGFQNLGPGKVFLYQSGKPIDQQYVTDTISYGNNEKIGSYSGIEPRLMIRYMFNASLSVKLSYNRTRQYIHFITNAISVTPVDYWKLSDQYVKAQVADQYALGIYKNFDNDTYQAVVETYFKNYQNLVDYKNGANLNLNPALEQALIAAKAYSYGVELSLKKNVGKITGMASYTFSRTFNKVITLFPQEQINNGKWYPGNSDRPHNLVLFASWQLGNGWNLSSNFVLNSGRPTTNPDGTYYYNGTVVVNYSRRNIDRLPLYHRLDISFAYDSRRFVNQRRYWGLNFSFYNVYSRKNAYSVYFQREYSNLKAYKLSVIGSIIPSLSFNFNF